MEQAIFAAGCFWGVQKTFDAMEGVQFTEVGYTGGDLDEPTYSAVCRGNTGHAEAIRLEFDPTKVSFTALLMQFFACHDPTTLNYQGPDVGTQYRSVIFYSNTQQQQQALAMIRELTEQRRWPQPIVTEVVPAMTFYRAEDSHQHYLRKHGSG